MIYLVLQIIFSSAFTLIIKWAQIRGREDVIAIGAVNYIAAALALLPFVFQIDFSATSANSRLENQTAQVESAEFDSTQIESGSANESDSVANAERKAESPARSPVMGAMITGGAMGGIYFIAFFFAIYAIKTVGASSASVVSVLSILMPIIVASFYWGQHPNTLQIVGIGLALVALSLIGAQKKPKQPAVKQQRQRGEPRCQQPKHEPS